MTHLASILFQQEAKEKGLQLTKSDLEFILHNWFKVPNDNRPSVMREYIRRWHVVLLECEDEDKGQDLGRKAANNYLSELVK